MLSAPQSSIKDSDAAAYGARLHAGKQHDLACHDIESLLASSQKRVKGPVKFARRPGKLFV